LKEYQSKFLLTPDVESDANFTHLDKNITITSLKHNPKFNINEPEQMKLLLKSLHILNNPLYFKERVEVVFVGYKEEERKDGSVLQIPHYREVKVQNSLFPKTFHLLRSAVISLSITAGARNGWRMDKAITNKLVKEETLTDNTEVKSSWFSKNKKNENGGM